MRPKVSAVRRKISTICLFVFISASLSGCYLNRNGTGVGTGGGNTAPFSLILTDAPPLGGDVLSFQIQITGAVLQPGNVSLLNTPLTVELTQLQAETGFISSFNVPTGTYTSLTVTFANPSMTILNETGGTVATNCLNGSICQLSPALVPSTVTFTGTPLLTLSGNTPAGATLDVSLRNLVQNDFSLNLTVSNAVTLTTLPTVALTAPIAELDEVVGKVSSIGANQFNLITTTGQVFSIAVDNNTTFSFPANICPAQTTFTCVTTSQIVEVDTSLLGNGTFLANSVSFEDDGSVPLVQGTLVALPGNPPTLMIVVDSEVPTVTNVPVGSVVNVTLQNPTTFQVDADGLTIPGGLSFASAADLLVGQEIQVRVSGAINAGAFSTNRVSMRMAQITAPVASINIPNLNFITNSLPSRFPVGSSILVQTFPPPQTEFVNATDITGLGAGTTVSVKGLLFNTPAQLQIGEQVAKRVVVRSSNGP
jgi:hypothetical protein